MKKLNAVDSYNLLVSVVDEFGMDYVDPGTKPESGGCDYTRYDEDTDTRVCGCIVGQALNKFGVDVEDLKKLWGSIAFLDDDVKDYYDIEMTVGARLVLRAAQRVQDSGETWGKALGAAEDTFHIVNSGGVE